jgi:hypothetical protein
MRYEPDFQATARWLRTSGELQRAVHATAEDIASRARALAPVDSGAYRAGIVVTDEPGDDRVGSRVTASAPHSAAVEFGNARTGGRGQAVLRRAAESS